MASRKYSSLAFELLERRYLLAKYYWNIDGPSAIFGEADNWVDEQGDPLEDAPGIMDDAEIAHDGGELELVSLQDQNAGNLGVRS